MRKCNRLVNLKIDQPFPQCSVTTQACNGISRLTFHNAQYSILRESSPNLAAVILRANNNKASPIMLEFIQNQAMNVEKIPNRDPEISVYVVDDFLANPELLAEYAKNKAYFGKVGDDRTAYPGIRDRMPSSYEHTMEKAVELVYGIRNPQIHRCMISLTTLQPTQLSAAQKMPHVDAFGDDQYASVHYLCGEPHGGTAIYRYRPRNLVRIRHDDRSVMDEMIENVRNHPEEHSGYLNESTSLFKQELVIKARWNRLILYPANLLHCALLSSPRSLDSDVSNGRLSVASFFRLEQKPHQ
ncbi:DUF6445 family protein [Gammaproteobacteria bacterium]|jgi:hypothetical protein|nr:DUF6445 family protein [Gammaproteobacteria bacterium]